MWRPQKGKSCNKIISILSWKNLSFLQCILVGLAEIWTYSWLNTNEPITIPGFLVLYKFSCTIVMPVTLVRQPDTFPHVFPSTWLQIGLLTYLSTCKTLKNAALYVLLILDSVTCSTSFQLKIKEVIYIHWEQPTLNH